MSKVFKTYIPALSMAFTFMILCATIYNIICGNTKDDFLYFVLEVGGFLLIAMVIDYLVGKINFNKYISHLCVCIPSLLESQLWVSGLARQY